MVALKPDRGLPFRLLAGERLLWQGAPDWWAVAKHIFHVRAMGGCLLAVLVWNVCTGATDQSLTVPLAAWYVAVSLVPVLVALGYAGWTAGQLEEELAQNSWLTVPADQGIVFTTPLADRWQAAASALGVDLSLLADYAGHA